MVFDPDFIAEHTLPSSEFIPFRTVRTDAAGAVRELSFPDPQSELGKKLILAGESALAYMPHILPLSKYLLFIDTGDRKQYETPYFERRTRLLELAAAELCERRGRFLSKLADILFAICEESTWVIPAHNYSAAPSERKAGTIAKMPEPVGENVYAIDLFSGATGGLVALIYYFFREDFEKAVSPLLNERILYELNNRIVKPYLATTDLWWMGYHARKRTVNNWNPWINSNVLTVAAYAVADLETRKALVRKCVESIGFYVEGLPEDGGCDEGPSYWDAAGACVLEFAEICHDLTGGAWSDFSSPMLVKMTDYIQKTNISGTYFFNCADAHVRTHPRCGLIRRFGKLSGNDALYAFGNEFIRKNPNAAWLSHAHAEASLRGLLDRTPDENAVYTAPKTMSLPTLEFAAARENSDTTSGFYLGIKGGNNAESHNHLDVGNFVVYENGMPLMIDAGVGTYTRFTFMAEKRYTMFAFRTEDHNLPTINGVGEKPGLQYHADDFHFDEDTRTVTMELAHAYGEDAGIASFRRTAALADGKVTVTDRIVFEKTGDAEFHYLLADEPAAMPENPSALRLAGGAVLRFSDGFSVTAEKVPLDDQRFRDDWKRDCLYRVVVKRGAGEKTAQVNLTMTVSRE